MQVEKACFVLPGTDLSDKEEAEEIHMQLVLEPSRHVYYYDPVRAMKLAKLGHFGVLITFVNNHPLAEMVIRK